MFRKTLIIGLGLIGGSFAKALKEKNLSKKTFACDFDQETIDYAKNSGIIDGGFTNLNFFSDELSSFDFIVVATPLSTYDEIFFDLKNFSGLVIDLGSIKNFEIKNLPKNFVPCHPIAGSENTGFEHSDVKLFFSKRFILCKKNSTVLELIRKIGAIPDFLDAKKHDEIYALVSHLPQFLSFLTVEFSPKKITDEFFKTAFRLDNSDPEIWSDIITMNEKNLKKFYDKFFVNLEKNINRSSHENMATTSIKFDKKFFEENFASIFFRALVVKSFLEIPEIKTFQNYVGSGFKDFTSIMTIFNYDAEKLKNLFTQNQKKISKLFNSIS